MIFGPGMMPVCVGVCGSMGGKEVGDVEVCWCEPLPPLSPSLLPLPSRGADDDVVGLTG